MFGGIFGHFILPVEKLQAIQYISSPDSLKYFTNRWIAQIFNDSLLSIFPFTAGYACYRYYHKKVFNGTFNYIKCILSRYIRVSIFALIAICAEFIYPLIGDGPAFTPMAERTYNDCVNNWWKHFTLDALSTKTRACAIHMFLGSIDVRLLVIGLIILWSFNKFGHRFTLTICMAIVIGSCVILHESVKHLNLPTFVSYPADVKLIGEAFYTTHFLFTYYLPGFIIGLMTAYFIENGYRLYKPNTILWLLNGIIVYHYCLAATFAPSLHTIFDIIPRPLYGLFIVGHRMSYFIGFTFLAFWFSHSDGIITMKHLPLWFKLMAFFFIKLGPSVHLVNLIYIRLHFSTSRQLISLRPYDLLIRVIAGGYICTVFSIYVHFMVISPLMKLFPKSQDVSKEKKIE